MKTPAGAGVSMEPKPRVELGTYAQNCLLDLEISSSGLRGT
jgi:hypothetical protein